MVSGVVAAAGVRGRGRARAGTLAASGGAGRRRRRGAGAGRRLPRAVGEGEVRELAQLARLEVGDAEVAEWAPQIGRIVGWFDRLAAVDTDGVEPLMSLADAEGTLPLREDAAVEFAEREAALAQSPAREGPYIKVPRIATGGDAPAKPKPAAADPALLSECEIRVGKVVAVERHPESEKLYVEKVDVGEAEPRTILSGLAPFVPLEAMDGRDVVVLCNLKPRNMGGIKSFGMLLCASDKAAEVPVVEPLAPPAGAPVGERVCFGEWVEDYPAPAGANKMNKKKIWDKVQPNLATSAEGLAVWNGDLGMTASTGPVRADLAGGNVS